MIASVPVSAVVATRNRPVQLQAALESLVEQDLFPSELIVIDSSSNDNTQRLTKKYADCRVRWVRAVTSGAASQRNEGVALAEHAFLWFLDDDVRLEQDCFRR